MRSTDETTPVLPLSPAGQDVLRRRIAEGVAAEGLVMVEAADLAIQRRRRGAGFTYHRPDGSRVTDAETLARIRSLAIPPAYRDVRIAEDPKAHLQAVGRDDKDRLQYRYHPAWEAVREEVKADRLGLVLASLPKIRRAVARDLADRRLSRRKALAAAVALIDASAIRVGCEAYLETSGVRGAATLMKRDVTVEGHRIRLGFRGKGGKDVACVIVDPRLARALARFGELPGRRLLKWLDDGGRPRRISAGEVNAYLRAAAGRPVSAKDLRMLAASASAAEQFVAMEPESSESRRRRQLAAVMAQVSRHLANTPAVVRKSYVHKVVVESFLDGTLKKTFARARKDGGRGRIENALRTLVGRRRLAPADAAE